MENQSFDNIEELESYRLDFLLDKCFEELFESYSELSISAKNRLLFELSKLVVEFSTNFLGGN